MEMLGILRQLSNKGHLVIITMQAIPEEASQLLDQLVLISQKQVSKNSTLNPPYSNRVLCVSWVQYLISNIEAENPCMQGMFSRRSSLNREKRWEWRRWLNRRTGIMYDVINTRTKDKDVRMLWGPGAFSSGKF